MRQFTLVLAILLSVCAGAREKTPQRVTTKASDSRITYIARTAVSEDGSVSFDWCASTVRVAFSGDYLAMKVSDSKKNYYNVWIDRDPDEEADFVITTFGNDSTVVIYDNGPVTSGTTNGSTNGKATGTTTGTTTGKATDITTGSKTNGITNSKTSGITNSKTSGSTTGRNAKKADHRVTLQKRTEGEQGTTTIHSFISSGELLQAAPLKARQIEVLGDSYTCGYGSENSVSHDRFTPATENVNKAYEAIIARYFDADLMTIAHSGMGITRNYNGEKKPAIEYYYMPERYTQTFDENREVKWDASKSDWKPSITVIYLGANDFSTGKQPIKSRFTSNYLTLLKQIKENYGEDHPILCCASKSDPGLFDYVREAALGCGLKNVRYAAIFPGVDFDDDRELGADSHPNYKAHKKIAHTLIPYVATLTGWDLTDNKIK